MANPSAASRLEATVDRREGDLVVLRTADGQELLWNARDLPAGVSEGSVVELSMRLKGEVEDEHRSRARDILNEIFGAGDTTGT